MVDPRNLLAGPRGRRLLLAFALASEQAHIPEYSRWTLHPAVSLASYQLDPGRGVSRKLVFPGIDEPERPEVTPEDVATQLAATPLVEVTPERLRRSLVQAVDNARYWQEPDGEDILAATSPVRSALERVALHIAASPHAEQWKGELYRNEQWVVHWTDEGVVQATSPAVALIASWRSRMPLEEERALRERPTDPAANFSGEWWSIPPLELRRSSRILFDDTPAGVWFVEDASGNDCAITIPVAVPADACVYEITGPDAWAKLCRRFPLDVSAGKRHDWYRATGRVGKWVMPDWAAVATAVDAVHLTAAAYLAAAGTAIDVDEVSASVIAGWNPDETWWFIDTKPVGEPVSWVRDSTSDTREWRRNGADPGTLA